MTDPTPPDHRRTKASLVTSVILVLAGLLSANLVVLAIRFVSVLEKGAFIETTGTERVPIYTIWKVARGLPAYEAPFTGDFSASLYNFAFYLTYGLVARVAGWEGDALVLGLRLLTLAITVATVGMFAWLMKSLLGSAGDDAAARRFTWLLASVTLLSSAGISWFSLTVRSDMLSMLWVVAGLGLYLRSLEKPRRVLTLAAAVSFFAAWACKQSTIGILGGVCCHAIWRRRWGQALWLGVPPAVLAVVSLALGGEAYRFNLLTVPGIADWSGWNREGVVPVFFRVFGVNTLLWVGPLVLLISAATDRLSSRSPRSGDGDRAVQLQAVGFAFVVSFVWCLMALARDGGYGNSLVEAYIAGSACACGVLWLRVIPWLARSGAVARVAFLCVLGASAAFPIAQTIWLDRLGNQTLASPDKAQEARLIIERLRGLPKPVFVEEHLFAEPWFSSDNRYPTVVLDNYLLMGAAGKGWIPSPGVGGLIAEKRFKALLLAGIWNLGTLAESQGYRKVDVLPGGLRHWEFELYVLDSPAGSPGSNRD